MDGYYNAEDLLMLRLQGDSPEEVERFLTLWEEIVVGLRTQMNEMELANILYDRIKNGAPKVFHIPLWEFKRHERERPGRGANTEEYLYRALSSYVDEHREEMNRRNRKMRWQQSSLAIPQVTHRQWNRLTLRQPMLPRSHQWSKISC